MVQFRRSSSSLPGSSPSRIRAAGPQPHRIPDYQSVTAGLNPGAIDTNLFTNFFSSLSNSVSQYDQNLKDAEIATERKINEVSKYQAVADAQRSFEDPQNKGKSGSDLLGSMPPLVNVQVGQETHAVDTSQRASYSETYSKTIGTLTGVKMYNLFLDDLEKRKLTPEEAEGAAAAYWTENFADGTGNPHHDAAAGKIWTDNIQTWRQANRVEINKRAQAKINLAADRAVFARANDQGFSTHGYYEAISDYKQADPRLTETQARAKVLSNWLSVAQTSPAKAAALTAFISNPQYTVDDESGATEPGQSLLKRFPKEMSVHLNNLYVAHAKYTTLTGQEAVARVGSILNATSLLPETTAEQIRNKEASFFTAALEIKRLEQIPGTNGSKVAALRADYMKQRSEFRAKVLSKNTFNQAAMNGERLWMEKADLDAAATAWLSSYDIQNNTDDAQNAAVGLRKVYLHNNGYIPQTAIDFIKDGLSTTDPSVIKNIVKFATALDPDRNILADKLKDHPMAAFMWEAYSTPGVSVDQTHTLFSGENFRKAFGQVDLNHIFANGEDLGTKAEQQKRVEENFFGDGGTGVKSLGERVADVAWYDFEERHLSPAVKGYALQIAQVVAAKHYAATFQMIGLDDLKTKVAQHLSKITIPMGDNTIDFNREAPIPPGAREVISRDKITGKPTYGKPLVRLGSAVPNWEGNIENTAETLWEDVQHLTNTGIIGLTTSDGREVDLTVRDTPVLRGTNQKIVYDLTANMPLLLPINQKLETQNAFYTENGEQKAYGWHHHLMPWSRGYEDQEVQFTGNELNDKKIASKFMHPSLRLVPVRKIPNDDSSLITGYYITVVPRFKDLSDNFLKQDALRAALGRPGPLVPRKPDPRQEAIRRQSLRYHNFSFLPPDVKRPPSQGGTD